MTPGDRFFEAIEAGADPAAVAEAADRAAAIIVRGARDADQEVVGERLLLLSCAAFEKMPEVLADIGTVPTELVRQDPENLLLEIFHDFGHGAGAVIDRLDVATSHLGAP